MPKGAEMIDQLRRAYEGDAWHGPAFELLAEVSAEQASARPIPGAHSIWEIVLHIKGWNQVFCGRLQGDHLDAPAEGDFPPIEDASPEAWARALASLEEGQRQLLQAISDFPAARLSETVPGKEYTFGFMLSGLLQHIVYHTGQVALLKKA